MTARRELPMYSAGSVDVPYVIDGFREVIEEDTEWPEHSHPTHELLWNDRGASLLTVGSRTWTLTATAGLWIPAGVRHRGTAPAGTWYRTAHFGIHSVPSISDDPVAVELTDLLRLLIDRLHEEGLSVDERTRTEGVVLDLLQPASREVVVQNPHSDLLAPVARALHEDPAHPGSLEWWAAARGVSSRTLARAFVAETGVGYLRWTAMLRAQRAIVLLARGTDTEDVARAVGYSTVSAFGAAFRRATGSTPGAFRPHPARPGDRYATGVVRLA